MFTKEEPVLWAVVFCGLFVSARAVANEEDPTGNPLGLSAFAEVTSIYNYRGMNTFMEDSISDQHAMFAPSLSWTIFETGLSIGYWGAYQISGNDVSGNIDGALGAEQDIFLGYELPLIEETLSLRASLTYFFYPLADEDVAGAANPSYLEPLLALDYSGPLSLGLAVSYFAGIQDELKLYRYLYINPTIGKTMALGGPYATTVGLSFGYKLFNERDKMKTNVYDLRFDWSFPIKLTDVFYLEPAVHVSWTNIDTKTVTVVDDAGEEAEVLRDGTPADGLMVYVSVLVGADF